MADRPKAIISIRLTDVLGWHIWTILSLAGTTTLLYLNISQYSIGGELGGSASSSANILGILQVVIKAHELAIVASLVAIVHQLILRNLMGGGLLLGLLGAEGALASPSFLISTRYRHALAYGIRSIYTSGAQRVMKTDPERPARLRMLWLAIFLFWCCLIAPLAGPASAVLMIPRVDWFHHSTFEYPPAMLSTLPNIMIGTSPGFLDGRKFWESNVFALPDVIVGSGYRYWRDISGYELRSPRVSLEDKSVHRFRDYFGQAYVNTTGSYNRSLDGGWAGGTRITTATRNIDYLYDGDPTEINLPAIKRGWADVKSVDTTQGFDAWVTCRASEKQACDSNSTAIPGNSSSPDWCYRSVNKNDTTGALRMGRNLLMASDFSDGWNDPRVWLTEGPRIEENKYYSDSIEVIFEKAPGGPAFMHALVVCSFSAVLVDAVATSYGTDYTGEKVEYLNHVLLTNGTTASPRKLLFHENWLDRAYGYDPGLWLSDAYPDITAPEGTLSPANYSYPKGSIIQPDNFTYPARPGLNPKRNSFRIFGSELIYAVGFDISDESQRARNEAFPVEATVGGILTYLLSWSLPGASQYSMPYEQIPERFRLGAPEAFPHRYRYEVYRRGYGFQLSTQTGYLGVAVLVSHAVIAIVASLRQLMRKSVIRAWRIPVLVLG